jgi:hypothetical protein
LCGPRRFASIALSREFRRRAGARRDRRRALGLREVDRWPLPR